MSDASCEDHSHVASMDENFEADVTVCSCNAHFNATSSEHDNVCICVVGTVDDVVFVVDLVSLSESPRDPHE